MTISASDLVQDISGLITLPDVYLRINRMVENPDSTIEDIAKAISQDPSFTMRLLKIANSALYSFPSSVNTVSRAVTIIGTSQIHNLALSMSVAKSFDGLPNDLVSMENFWKHSLLCALSARILARQAGRCDPEALFTAGLLHDIGELIIFNRLSGLARKALTLVLDTMDEMSVSEAEYEVMGFDHGDVGGELARQWKLPPLLEECIAYHHHIENAKRYPRETALTHIANIFSQMAELDTLDSSDVPPINPRSWEITGLTEESMEPTVREAQAEIAEVTQLFLA
ncbi:MAG TPA: HDOD domain-containing protein [Sulfuricella sp.]|nr:HDOD domain-containing protein [Sulfuricella sp.]